MIVYWLIHITECTNTHLYLYMKHTHIHHIRISHLVVQIHSNSSIIVAIAVVAATTVAVIVICIVFFSVFCHCWVFFDSLFLDCDSINTHFSVWPAHLFHYMPHAQHYIPNDDNDNNNSSKCNEIEKNYIKTKRKIKRDRRRRAHSKVTGYMVSFTFYLSFFV